MHDPPRDAEDLDREADALVLQALRGKPRPVDFASLDEEQAAEQLEALGEWVHWLVGRYRIDHREIPPCWDQHGELIEELSALRTARQGAYARDAPLNGPSDWHQTLATTRQRLSLAVARTGCRPGEHRIYPLPAWLADRAGWPAGHGLQTTPT